MDSWCQHYVPDPGLCHLRGQGDQCGPAEGMVVESLAGDDEEDLEASLEVPSKTGKFPVMKLEILAEEKMKKDEYKCCKNNVPNIAILGSGGGLRAMIALQGILGELQKQDLLDIVMCMSYIYEHEEWGKQLPSLEDKLCHKLVNPHRDWNKALKSLVESSKDDTYSLTDFWGNVVVYIMLHELDDHHLSDEQKISKNGIVPYPIYAAVDATKLDAVANQIHSDIWFEFTPHEAGFFNPGAFVDVTLLGSKFEDGELKEKKNEKKMSYLRDILKKLISHYVASEYRCSCDYCEVALETTQLFDHIMENQICIMENKTHVDLKKYIINITEILKNNGPSDTYNFCCTLKEIDHSLDLTENGKHFLKMVETLQLEFTAEKKVIINHKELKTSPWDILKFIYKTFTCILKWKWGNISNYTYKYIDLKDKNLTDKTDVQLADAGIVINSAYPLILRPERKVELILSFDFSDGDPFETIKKSSQYCKENKLPFPEIDAQNLDKDKDNPEDCYIFKGNGCPTVMHFPLFNRVNCGGNISDWRNRYKTFSISYPEQDIKNLLEAAKKNVKNNTKNILQMLKA
ncbi:hypothetical protein E2320_003030, partial [Naja naja]